MAKNYDFRLVTTRPAGTGWTAASINEAQAAKAAHTDSSVGPVNAMAQAPITADALRTTPSTLSDSALGSRRYLNPNTGIRDVAASGSVYQQANVPAYLSQAVAGLNAEQALRRSLQAEWNNRLIRNAESSEDPYMWLEAIRAASVNPGASVAFGQSILNPNTGRADVINASANALLSGQRAGAISDARTAANDVRQFQDRAVGESPLLGLAWNPRVSGGSQRASNALQQSTALSPIATAAAGGGGWAPRYSGWGSAASRPAPTYRMF